MSKIACGAAVLGAIAVASLGGRLRQVECRPLEGARRRQTSSIIYWNRGIQSMFNMTTVIPASHGRSARSQASVVMMAPLRMERRSLPNVWTWCMST
jgi:hypothetical protein